MTEHEFYTAIKGLAKGNKDMLHAIYDAYGRLIYTIVYDILKNREDAEDVTSEFFIKLIRAEHWESRPRGRFPQGRAAHRRAAGKGSQCFSCGKDKENEELKMKNEKL